MKRSVPEGASGRVLRALVSTLAVVAGAGGVLVLGAALAFSLVVRSCVQEREVARVPSPDGVLDAVLVESNGGATVSILHLVHVVESGNEPREESAASLYRTDRRIDLRWHDTGHLIVTHRAADIVRLDAPAVEVAGRSVRVELNLEE